MKTRILAYSILVISVALFVSYFVFQKEIISLFNLSNSSLSSVGSVEITPLSVTCSSGTQTAPPGTAITYTAEPRGGDGNYTFFWKGNDGLTNSAVRWSGKTYTTTGVKTATIVVTSASQMATADCGVTIIDPSAPAVAPLTVSCSAGVNTVPVGTQVTYSAYPQGGNNLYKYSWSGSDGIANEGYRWQGIIYKTAGTKKAIVTVTSAELTATGECGTNVVTAPVREIVEVPAKVSVPISYPQIGVNIEELTDYGVSSMFADVMKSARSFSDPNAPWSTTTTVPVDQNGWPTTDFGVLVFTEQKDAAGIYKLKFTGDANVKPIASVATVINPYYDKVTNITTADVAVTGNQLALSFTGTSGGVKNISLLRPGHTSSDVFNKNFLAAIKEAQVLRVMDYLNTNNNPLRNWEDRPKATDALQGGTMKILDSLTGQAPIGVDGKPIAECPWIESPAGSGRWIQSTTNCTPWQTRKGATIEYAIELANLTGKDLWINIPSEATTDYITQLARLLKSKLNSNIKIYLEYSNEVWNGQFVQHALARKSAQKEVQAGDISLTNNGAFASNDYHVLFNEVAKKIVNISNIFRGVYGSAAMNTQVRPILAIQLANLDTGRTGLEYIEKNFGKPSNFIYGLAGAPYYIAGIAGDTPGASVDALINGMATTINSMHKSFIPFVTLAKSYGLQAVAYEAGSDTAVGAENSNKYTSANDIRMKDLTMKFLSQWYGCGGDLLMYYNLAGLNTKYGTWGLTDNITKVMPKLQGFNSIAHIPLNAFQCSFADEGTAAKIASFVQNPSQGNGLSGTYFSSLDLKSPLFTQDASTINFDWSAALPLTNLPASFSASWSGYLTAVGTGTFNMSANTGGADGIRVTVGSTKVIDTWPTPNPASIGTAKTTIGNVNLTAGTAYPIKVEYYHQATYEKNTPILQLLWSGPNQPKAIISAGQLSH